MSNRIGKTQGKPELEEDEVLVDLEKEFEEEEEEEQEEEQTKETSEAKGETEDEFELPEKFKGKSIKDIVESYTNLEKEYGRRNNEVGQQRKLIDQLLDLERPKKEEAEEEEKLDADSLLENPADAIAKAVENNPTLKALAEKLTSNDRAVAKDAFEKAHPDWQAVMGSADFAEWILKSEVRKEMFIKADKEYDYATGAQLVSDFKELHPTPSTEESDEGNEDSGEEEAAREEAAKAVTTEKKSKSRSASRKIYSRAQLIELAVRDPEQYARRQEEFRKAYEEGRVRR